MNQPMVERLVLPVLQLEQGYRLRNLFVHRQEWMSETLVASVEHSQQGWRQALRVQLARMLALILQGSVRN